MTIPGVSVLLSALPLPAAVVIPDPDPVPLPGPIGLLWFLLLLTVVLHFLLMNGLVGGTTMLLASHLRLRGAVGETAVHHRRLVQVLARALPAGLAFTITLGIAPLLFVQVLYGPLFFSSAVLMAWPWLILVGLVLVAYYAAYLHAYQHEAPGKLAGWLTALILVLVLTVAFLFTNALSLLQSPEAWHGLYARDRLGLIVYAVHEPRVWLRLLHFLFAPAALTGLAVALVAWARRRAAPSFAGWATRYGARWFVWGTLLQAGSGVLFLLGQPARVRESLLGATARDAVALGLAVVCAALAVLLLALAQQPTGPRLFFSAATIGITVLLMVFLRQRVRTLALAPHFRYDALAVQPQWGAIVLFALLLVAGLVLVGWMVWKFGRSPGSRAPSG